MRTTSHSGSPGGRARVALTLTCATLGLAIAVPGADAEFSVKPCNGQPTSGRGATFQASAQAGFAGVYYSEVFCGATAPPVGYDALGSGAGLRSFGVRDAQNPLGFRAPEIRFAATDEPPSPIQTDQMQKGEVLDAVSLQDKTASDDGVVHVIPVAVGANAIVVNYPNGCTIPDASLANPRSPTQADRIKLTAAQIEAAFAADTSADTWGKLVPTITGTPTDPALSSIATCAAVPVRRVVRFDPSGTTFVLKDWLRKVNENRSPAWGTGDNTAWPGTVGEATFPADCALTSNLCRNNANGNGPLLDRLVTVDGGIGYADIATARAKGFDVGAVGDQSAPPLPRDTTFWVPIVNSGGTAFEPTFEPGAWLEGVDADGANCSPTTTVFGGVPGGTDPTLGSWASVSATGNAAATFYPLCALTFMLAWDDNARVYGASAAEEGKARTVKDFLIAATSSEGQAVLNTLDYAALPDDLRIKAQNGVSAIDWNKGGGGTTQPPVVTPPPPPPAGPPAPPPTAPTPVSNAFTIPKATTSSTAKGASIVLSVQVPNPGSLAAIATSTYKLTTGKGTKKKTTTKKVTLGRVSGKVTAAGTVKLTIKVGAAGLAALKKAKQLKVAIKVTYTPTGGSANSASKSVTLKAAKKKATKKR